MKIQRYLILTLLLLACESKVNYKVPDDLIPKEQMIDLLYDMHLDLGTSNVQNINLEKNRNYMSLVLDKYKIDSLRFASSNIYYVSNAKEYEEIFEEVEERLKELQESYRDEIDSLIK